MTEAIPVSDLLADTMTMQAGRTRKAYAGDLRAFAKFAGIDDVDEVLRRLVSSSGPVANGVVLAYQAAMRRQGLAKATINRRISAVRAVMRLARGVDLTTVSLGLVRNLKVEEKTRDVRGPGMKVVRAMITVCDADDSHPGRRDAAMLRWLILLGLRRNEVRTLLLRDCHLDDEIPTIWVEQKGREKKQPIQVNPKLHATLERWLEVRGAEPGAVFCSLSHRVAKNAVMDSSSLNKILHKRAVQAGYKDGVLKDGRRITPHGIRHTAISEVARAKGLVVAQAFARHQNPQTTNRYLDEKDEMSLEAQEMMLDGLLEL